MSKEKVDLSTPAKREAFWTEKASSQLLGRRIVKVRYMDKKEMEDLGWSSRPIVMQLDDGNVVFASADDEGNDGGSLFTNDDKVPVLPVLSS